MSTRRALSPEAAMKIKQLYAKTDQWGKHVHSQMEIAKMMGVGETTIFRVLKSSGAYMALPELVVEGEAEASLADFKERFPELAPGHSKLVEELKEHGKGDQMVDEMRSPLDE